MLWDFKLLIFCYRYFSKLANKIVIYYLGIVEIVKAIAKILAKVIVEFLGTDDAKNLCEKHNSVFIILKQQFPPSHLVKCVAHSLHVCCSKAATVSPSSLDFLF